SSSHCYAFNVFSNIAAADLYSALKQFIDEKTNTLSRVRAAWCFTKLRGKAKGYSEEWHSALGEGDGDIWSSGSSFRMRFIIESGAFENFRLITSNPPISKS